MAVRNNKKSAILDGLREKSRKYAFKANLLSKLLEESEEFLCELPAKIAVATDSDEYYQLSFEKTSQGWRLLIKEFGFDGTATGGGKPVLESSLSYKAEAAQLLPDLYDKLVNHLDGLQTEIDEGLERLKALPFLVFDDDDDGAGDGIYVH